MKYVLLAQVVFFFVLNILKYVQACPQLFRQKLTISYT